jgi:hypothetical protein
MLRTAFRSFASSIGRVASVLFMENNIRVASLRRP